MANSADVEVALCNEIVATMSVVAPGGAVLPKIRVFRGSATAPRTVQDRASRVTDIAVALVAGSARNTSRFLGLACGLVAAPGLTTDVIGSDIEFVGVAHAGDGVGVIADGVSWSWHAHGGEDGYVVAALVGEALGAATPAVVSGNVVSLPAAKRVAAKTVGAATLAAELGRTEEDYLVTISSPSPNVRDMVSKQVISSLSGISFLQLGDGEQARLRHSGDESVMPIDGNGVFTARAKFTCEYPITAVGTASAMIFGTAGFGGHYATA